MNLKKLIARMDQIESKKFLTEGEKKETSWTDMKGQKHTATKVKGKSYGNQSEPKEVDDEGKPKKKVKEGLGIAEGLLKSFGITEAVLTPDQQAKLNGANAQDPYIINNNLGKDAVPVSYFKDPEDQKIARQLGFKDAPATPAPQQAAPQQAAPSGTGLKAPAGVNLAPNLGTAAGATPAAATPAAQPAPSQSTVQWPTDKGSIIAFQKANRLVPDGLIGQKTMAALQAAGATPPAGFKPVANRPVAGQSAQAAPAGAGRGGQGGPTAPQMAVGGAGAGRGGQGGPTTPTAPQASQADVRKADNAIAAQTGDIGQKLDAAKAAEKEATANLQRFGLAQQKDNPTGFQSAQAALASAKTARAEAEKEWQASASQEIAGRKMPTSRMEEAALQTKDNEVLNLIRSFFIPGANRP